MPIHTPCKLPRTLAIASALLLGTTPSWAQTYTGSRTSDANCNDLRVNCEAKANRSDARQNTGAGATARIGASAINSAQTTMRAWDSFSKGDSGKSISELWRENEGFLRQLDEEDRRRKEKEAFLKTPEGKRQYYGQLAGKGNAHHDFLYWTYASDPSKPAETFKWLKLAADGGEPRAQYMLAFRMRLGFDGLQADGKEAFDWAAKAAAGGMPQGLGMMANMLYQGEGLPENLPAALTLAQPGCEKHSSEACETLGQMYRYGDGVPKDLAAARKAFEQAVADGDIRGGWNIDSSIARANFALAEMYANGEGVPRDQAKARSYMLAFTKAPLAIMESDRWVVYSTELVYGPDGNFGFERDLEQGMKLLRRTASRKAPQALDVLGTWTAYGKFGLPKDVNAGIGFLKEAAEMNYALSALKLAVLLMNNDKDEEGFKWLQKAANLRNKDAMYQLGISYYKGYGVAPNAALGRDSLLKACDAGHGKACFKASELAGSGEGAFAKDSARARQLAQRAQELGYTE